MVLLIWVSLAIPGRSQVIFGFQSEGPSGDLVPAVQLLLLPTLNTFFVIGDFFLGLYYFRWPERQAISLYRLGRRGVDAAAVPDRRLVHPGCRLRPAVITHFYPTFTHTYPTSMPTIPPPDFSELWLQLLAGLALGGTDRLAGLAGQSLEPQRGAGGCADRRADLWAGRAGLGGPAAGLFHLLQPALAPVRPAQAGPEREILQGQPARLGPGDGQRRAGGAAGGGACAVPRPGLAVAGLCRGDGGGERRHLGHRAGGAQPHAAAPDHQRKAGGAGRHRGRSACGAAWRRWVGQG